MASGSFTKKSGSGKDFDPLGLAAKPENDFLSPSFAASKPKKEDLIVYEVLLRDFDSDRNFQDLIDKINYFKNKM